MKRKNVLSIGIVMLTGIMMCMATGCSGSEPQPEIKHVEASAITEVATDAIAQGVLEAKTLVNVGKTCITGLMGGIVRNHEQDISGVAVAGTSSGISLIADVIEDDSIWMEKNVEESDMEEAFTPDDVIEDSVFEQKHKMEDDKKEIEEEKGIVNEITTLEDPMPIPVPDDKVMPLPPYDDEEIKEKYGIKDSQLEIQDSDISEEDVDSNIIDSGVSDINMLPIVMDEEMLEDTDAGVDISDDSLLSKDIIQIRDWEKNFEIVEEGMQPIKREPDVELPPGEKPPVVAE